MKHIIVLLLVFLFLCTVIESGDQDNLAEIFTGNFLKGNAGIKYKVLKDAVDMEITGMETLFHAAIRYVVDNLHSLDTNADLLRIAQLSVLQLHQMNYGKAAADLFTLFTGSRDIELNVNILITLGDIASDDLSIIEKMNQWLEAQNHRFLSGKNPDMQVLIACIQSLGKMGHPSSFLPLFTAIIVKYSIMVTSTAEQALDSIKGELAALYMDVIREARYADKREALAKALKSVKLAEREKCTIAMFSLEIGINSSPADMEQKNFSLDMRSIAAEFLGRMGWTDAADLLIGHFNQTLSDMDKGRADKSYLIKAITALGSMKSHDAAKRLALYLEYMNSYTEKYKVYDEQIVLAVIEAMKKLGDNVANAALLYARYLDYGKTVREAAEEALKALR